MNDDTLILCLKPLYAIPRPSPTQLDNNHEELLLRYLRLFVSSTTDYGQTFSNEERSEVMTLSNERARVRHLATTRAKFLVGSIQSAATALLETVAIDDSELSVRLPFWSCVLQAHAQIVLDCR